MLHFVGKLLILCLARKLARRPTAAAETAVVAAVLLARRSARSRSTRSLAHSTSTTAVANQQQVGGLGISSVEQGNEQASRSVANSEPTTQLFQSAPSISSDLGLKQPQRRQRRLLLRLGQRDVEGTEALLAIAEFFFLPAAFIKACRLARRLLLPKSRRKLNAEAALEAPRTVSGTPIAPPTSTPAVLPRPMSKAQLGNLHVDDILATYAPWVAVFRQVLERQQVVPLPQNFDPDGKELVRFLGMGGLPMAKDRQAANAAMGRALSCLRSTLQWWQDHEWASNEQMQRWRDVIWWSGPDDEGFLWLNLHLARASKRCNNREAWNEAAQVLVTQIEYGVRHLMRQEVAATSGEEEVGSEITPAVPIQDRMQIVVVAKGSNIRQALKMVGILRQLTVSAFRNYPMRLRSLYLVEPPGGLWLATETLLNLLPPHTRRKVKVCKLQDLPDQAVASITQAEEQATSDKLAAVAAVAAVPRRRWGRWPRLRGRSLPPASIEGSDMDALNGPRRPVPGASKGILYVGWVLRVLILVVLAGVLVLSQRLGKLHQFAGAVRALVSGDS